MCVPYEGDKKAFFLFHCGLLLFCMTDDDGDWVGQIRLFPYSALKCLTFALLSFSFSSSSLSPRQKGACRFWIRQGPHLTPAASGPGNQTSSGCLSRSPSPDFGTCPWPAGGAIINLVTEFTFHDEIIHFVIVLDDQIFQSRLHNQGFKVIYQKMCLEIPFLIFKPRNCPKFRKYLFNPVQRNCCEQS